MTPHYNFQKYAILCDNWQQMLHLASLAERQGYIRIPLALSKDDFEEGANLFIATENGMANWWTASAGYTNITYTTFINSHPDHRSDGC